MKKETKTIGFLFFIDDYFCYFVHDNIYFNFIQN